LVGQQKRRPKTAWKVKDLYWHLYPCWIGNLTGGIRWPTQLLFFPKIKKKYVLGTGSLRASWKKPLRKMLQHVTFSTLSLIAIFVTAEYF